MSALTVVLPAEPAGDSAPLESWTTQPAVSRILRLDPAGSAGLPADPRTGEGLRRILQETATDYLLLVLPGGSVGIGQRGLERLLSVAQDAGAGWVYSDVRDEVDGQPRDHPLIDYQAGSLRDTFDFGSLVLLSKAAAESALRAGGGGEGLRWGGLYDLRLKLSESARILRIPEPLYTRVPSDRRTSGERGFDYVDPRQRDYQLEMEAVAS